MQTNRKRKRHRSFALFLIAAIVVSILRLMDATPASAASGNVSYTYDALGRVTTASYDTGVIVIYTYDANGNRTQQKINVNSATLCWTTVVAGCTTTVWSEGLWN